MLQGREIILLMHKKLHREGNLESKIMQHLRKTLGILTLMLLALGSISVQAQQPRFLSLIPPEGLPIIPIMEGWIVNPNGSRSFSYGYLNRNQDAVDIPLGEANFMDPTVPAPGRLELQVVTVESLVPMTPAVEECLGQGR